MYSQVIMLQLGIRRASKEGKFLEEAFFAMDTRPTPMPRSIFPPKSTAESMTSSKSMGDISKVTAVPTMPSSKTTVTTTSHANVIDALNSMKKQTNPDDDDDTSGNVRPSHVRDSF